MGADKERLSRQLLPLWSFHDGPECCDGPAGQQSVVALAAVARPVVKAERCLVVPDLVTPADAVVLVPDHHNAVTVH